LNAESHITTNITIKEVSLGAMSTGLVSRFSNLTFYIAKLKHG